MHGALGGCARESPLRMCRVPIVARVGTVWMTGRGCAGSFRAAHRDSVGYPHQELAEFVVQFADFDASRARRRRYPHAHLRFLPMCRNARRPTL